MTDLTAANGLPDKLSEIERIRAVARAGEMIKVKPTKIDVFVEAESGELFLFDIKTAKPNAGGFKEFKRTLLEWVAAVLADTPDAQVNSLIAIPYNPYPKRTLQSLDDARDARSAAGIKSRRRILGFLRRRGRIQ